VFVPLNANVPPPIFTSPYVPPPSTIEPAIVVIAFPPTNNVRVPPEIVITPVPKFNAAVPKNPESPDNVTTGFDNVTLVAASKVPPASVNCVPETSDVPEFTCNVPPLNFTAPAIAAVPLKVKLPPTTVVSPV
jgi:hypothetical protein